MGEAAVSHVREPAPVRSDWKPFFTSPCCSTPIQTLCPPDGQSLGLPATPIPVSLRGELLKVPHHPKPSELYDYYKVFLEKKKKNSDHSKYALHF